MSPAPKLLFIVNADWYFSLHWIDRAVAARDAGYEVHVATPRTDAKHLQLFGSLGLRCHEIRLARRSTALFGELRTLWITLRLLYSVKPAIIHSVTIKPNIYAGLLARLLNLPLVATVPGLGSPFSPDPSFKGALTRRLLLWAYRLALGHRRTAVLFENSDDLASLVASGAVPAANAILIPGAGVDIAEYRHAEPPPAPPVRVLFAARLLRSKGLEELIQASQQLRAQGAFITLLVAGIHDDEAEDAIATEELERWSRNGVIEWLGQVAEMPALISSCHIVCLPTRYREGIPRILIEGAACGRPLLATDTPGCREIVVDGVNGLLAAPGSIGELANRLGTLVADAALRQRMGLAGRALVEQRFSSTHVIKQTLSVYRELETAR